MTRFARAHGSKASNERIPEEATSWSTMKQQMAATSKFQKEERAYEKVTSVYMKGQQNDSVTKSVNKVWEVFDTDTSGKENNMSKKDTTRENICKNGSSAVQSSCSKKRKNSLVDVSENRSDSDTAREKCCVKGNTFVITPNQTEDITAVSKNNFHNIAKHEHFKSKKENNSYDGSNLTKQKKNVAKSSVSDSKCIPVHVGKNKKIAKKGKFCEPVDNTVDDVTVTSENCKNNVTKNKNYVTNENTNFSGYNSQTNFKKMKTYGNDFSFSNANKFNNSQRFSINVGGRIVEISDFQGFAVKKEDAQRLYKLRKDLLSKGLPRKEVEIALKLERRRAEKALAREKKVVCYKCRKSGHNMAECTECDDPNGVCFKCGSTEHSVRECRVVQSESFRYAHCFICQEQGHIARQCPDNPRGLYPKGGACKVCGDVTHLKKDCPKLISEKDKSTITIGTVQNSSIELLDEDLNEQMKTNRPNLNKKTRFVKF